LATEHPPLELRAVQAGYTGVPVLRGIDLTLEPRTITAVIGANGAGKSTLLKTIFGVVRTSTGSIHHDGADVTRLGSVERLKRGLALVPQGRCNFPLMTVQENLEMGAYLLPGRDLRGRLDRVFGTFEVLAEKRRELAGNLSGGQQQLLEMGMALMLEPKVILLDEPSLGLSPAMRERVFECIVALRDELGVTSLLVEQNAVQALAVADRAIVIETGTVAMSGSGLSMLDDPEVRQAYLGLSV
jgi:ABC-type branched-subunit amino acid transport system ATPase component